VTVKSTTLSPQTTVLLGLSLITLMAREILSGTTQGLGSTTLTATYASETWVNGTTNTELATLAEAMEGASSYGDSI
jgi:hypothetical protein